MLVSFGPLSLLQTANVQLENINFLAYKAADTRSSSAEVSMNKLLDIGACTSPNFEDCAVLADLMHFEAVNEFVPDHEGPAVEHPKRGQLL